jgi:hypothetical protein
VRRALVIFLCLLAGAAAGFGVWYLCFLYTIYNRGGGN